jgi:pyruvate dehydrogenase E2 component (dihydrolipoamide acetyltransferase)
MTIEIKVPDIGDFDGVEIIEVLVKAGDTVAAEQSIITVESDKASMEIPCPQAGVVKEMKVKIGDKVKEGTLMLILEPAGESAAAAAPKAEEAPKAEAPKAESAPALRLCLLNHTTQLLRR